MEVLADLFRIKRTFTTKYHPQCNGMIEKFHQFLKQRLALKAADRDLDFLDGDNWDEYIPSIMFAYNASVHITTGYSLFELLYGRKVRLPIDQQFFNSAAHKYRTYEEWLNDFLDKLKIIHKDTYQIQWAKCQALNEKQNQGRRPFPFNIGDWVAMKIFHTGPGKKLKPRFSGPYEIVKIADNKVTFHIVHVHNGSKHQIHGEWLALWTKRT